MHMSVNVDAANCVCPFHSWPFAGRIQRDVQYISIANPAPVHEIALCTCALTPVFPDHAITQEAVAWIPHRTVIRSDAQRGVFWRFVVQRRRQRSGCHNRPGSVVPATTKHSTTIQNILQLYSQPMQSKHSLIRHYRNISRDIIHLRHRDAPKCHLLYTVNNTINNTLFNKCWSLYLVLRRTGLKVAQYCITEWLTFGVLIHVTRLRERGWPYDMWPS
jgi:hypothetical protein